MLSIFTLMIAASLALATIINVPGTYPTIQAGVNAANPGDTVLVAPGFYPENVQMREGVNLFGSGWENTTVDGGGLTDVIKAYQVNNVRIEGFTVQNAQQSGSAPGCIGIFLNPISSTGTKIVRNCRVRHNGHGLQIWNDFGGVAYIEHNVIEDNLYDGFYPYLGTVYLTNNTIVDNGRDGYNDWSGGGAIYIQNNIIANNGRYGIYKHLNTPVFISFNDVWNNAQGAYMQGFSGPAQPFIPNPGTGEIAADPLFAGNPFGYYITWWNFPTPDSTKSPCIDVGNPSSPNDPDNTRADMGALYFDQTWHDLTIGIGPGWPPIVIPPAGGYFQYTVSLANNELNSVNFDAWIMVTIPSGLLYGPVLGPLNLTFPGGATITRLRQQWVPGSAPAGNYLYCGYVGVYPTTIWSGDTLTFSKTAVDGDGPISEWLNTGEEFELNEFGGTRKGAYATRSVVSTPPEDFQVSVAPNPFNPTTVISFELRVPSVVKLEVLDVKGQRVGTGPLKGAYALAPVQYPVGLHQIIFDGSALPSGVYVYRLQAGEMAASGKLVLLK